jgi:hypothetical protein
MRHGFWKPTGMVLKAAILAVLVVGAGAGTASFASTDHVPAWKAEPKAGPRVTPRRFNGDVRHIPRGNIVVRERRPEPEVPAEAPGPFAIDGATQSETATAAAPSPTTDFAGLDFANFGAGWPPDTNGDVGPNHYIQTVNTSIGIFDKATGTRVAAFTFDSFFSNAATGTPCDNSNQGDPVVLYDPIGDRWIISDFAWADYTSGAMYECMAVSQSGDPVSGGWYFYAWKVNNGGAIPDYPKLAVWPDGIYMSVNNFATTGSGSFQNVQVWAFDRVAMEAGAPAGSVSFNLPRTAGGVTVFSLLPSNARVVTGLPAAGTPNYFASIYGAYAIRVWKFHADFANTSASTLTGPTNASTATFSVGPSTVPEKGGNNLDTLTYRLMMQNQYTNLAGKESLWLTHTVGSGGSPNIAQPRWYQLPVTGGVIASSPSQQSTWAPDSKNRFMPSLAVDKDGDMAIGYSVSDSTMYPSIRYAGRLAGDAPNTLGQSETSMIEGTGFQCCTFSDGSKNERWGDYSAMTIDPDGCTFWYTTEYYDTQPTTLRGTTGDNWKTRIGSFRFPSCGSTMSAPSISSFTPTSGASGTSVTLSGGGFTGATSVAFNGTAATFTVDSDAQITATVPSGATSGPISVTAPGGSATSTSAFTVTTSSVPAPRITSFSPTSGRAGTAVTINGTAFTGATSVTFGGGTSATFTVSSDTRITTNVPSGATTGRISVTTPGGIATSSTNFKVKH